MVKKGRKNETYLTLCRLPRSVESKKYRQKTGAVSQHCGCISLQTRGNTFKYHFALMGCLYNNFYRAYFLSLPICFRLDNQTQMKDGGNK